MENIAAIYDSLLESKELYEMFPNAKGTWIKDEKEFKRIYEENISMLDDLDIDDTYEEYYEN
jgi:hypothetical protein